VSAALAEHLARIIADDGPISTARYMAEVLGHPTLGYYMCKDPFGAAGDFVTAPEISQMFGEMIGLWCAEVWRAMGAPDPVLLVELGPGRGTLMSDILRAARIVPEFDAAIECHLVETSPMLKDAQRGRIERFCVWHADLATVPRRPMLLIANEFFDALPVHQYVRTEAGWRERRVDTAERGESFRFVLAAEPLDGDGAIPSALRACAVGDIVEVAPERCAVAQAFGQRVAARGGAALIVDYGHARTAPGDTLQAVRRHRYSDPLADPGESDLTAHVDFEALANAATSGGAVVSGPVEQGVFLKRLGMERRAAALAKVAGDAGAPRVAAAFERLTAPDQMGSLFKAMAARDRRLPEPPGF
jgi:NADH dehydrogenase [ubiquinone] 1 alpha subcomplex assembly factor 7